MNPRDLVGILETMRAAAYGRAPWAAARTSTNRIALAKHRVGEQDWFPVSPALHKTVKKLTARLVDDCLSAILDFEDACADHGIEGGR